MATTKDYRDYAVEKLNFLGRITCRSMMGEYLLYLEDVLFGGIYDNQVLIKVTLNNTLFQLPEVIPYPGAKAMYYLKDLEDEEQVSEIILTTCKDLPVKKKNS